MGLAASVLSPAACTTKAEDQPYFGKTEPPDGQYMRYISGSEPESLDPHLSSGQPEARLYLALYDGLTEYHPETGEAIPSLAERWEPNGDNSAFTFHLRDAKWSNGDPITAHDFVYSLRRGLEAGARVAIGVPRVLRRGAQAYNEGKGSRRDYRHRGDRRSDAEVSADSIGPVFSGTWSRISSSGRFRARRSRRTARHGRNLPTS